MNKQLLEKLAEREETLTVLLERIRNIENMEKKINQLLGLTEDTTVANVEPAKEDKPELKATLIDNGCKYRFTRGKSKGQLCGKADCKKHNQTAVTIEPKTDVIGIAEKPKQDTPKNVNSLSKNMTTKTAKENGRKEAKIFFARGFAKFTKKEVLQEIENTLSMRSIQRNGLQPLSTGDSIYLNWGKKRTHAMRKQLKVIVNRLQGSWQYESETKRTIVNVNGHLWEFVLPTVWQTEVTYTHKAGSWLIVYMGKVG